MPTLASPQRRRWFARVMGMSSLLMSGCVDQQDARLEPVAQRRALRTARLRISGSNVLAPMMSAMGQQYQVLHPGVTVAVTSTDTPHVIAALRAETDVIGMSERRLRDNERDITAFPIARDGLVFAVSPHNPATSLTGRDVMALTSADTSARNSALMRTFRQLLVVPGGRDVVDLLSWHYPNVSGELPAAWRSLSLGSALDILDQDREALVLMPLAMGQVAIGQGRDLRFLAIDEQFPLERNLLRGQYRLMHPVQLLTRSLPEGENKLFIDYCLSAQATPIVRDFGFIPYFE